MTSLDTREKVQKRILAEIANGAPTLRRAAEDATQRALADARANGLSAQTQMGMITVFAQETVALASAAADVMARR